jgi:hypothetical protein
MIPHRETFMHLFFECVCINRTVMDFATVMLQNENDAVKQRIGILTGSYDNVRGNDAMFLSLTSIFLCYSIWLAKSKKIIPSLATLCNDVDQFFLEVSVCSKKFRNWLKHPMFLFAGDGERADTVAVSGTGGPPPDLAGVRTRQDLASLINSALDPLAIKQEVINDTQDLQHELMDFDDPDNFLECLDPDLNNTFGESDGEGEEEGGELVVYDQEEGEDDDGSGYEEDDGTEGGGESAEDEAGGRVARGRILSSLVKKEVRRIWRRVPPHWR